MSKLTAEERRHLPSSRFGLPETRQYPLPDRQHAIQALRELHNATPAQQRRIKRRVRELFPGLHLPGLGREA